MDLLETLSLTIDLEINLELKDEKIKAIPATNITDELREAIRTNKEKIVEHLQRCKKNDRYQLLTDIASAGITLRLKSDGLLTARPPQSVSFDLRRKIKDNKEWLCGVLQLDQDKRIETEAEARLLIRSQFDTDLDADQPLTEREFWVKDDREAFYFPERVS